MQIPPSALRNCLPVLAALLVFGGAAGAEEAAPEEAPEAARGYLIEGKVLQQRLYRGGAMAFDAVLLRPIGGLRTLAGAFMFLPAAMMSYPEGEDGPKVAFEHFVEGPGRELIERPLGDF